MAGKWKTLAPGIRVREHPSRRHGSARRDRYFTLRFSVEGRQVEEALGWASEGWTLERAQEELGKLRQAKRTGEGPATLRERVRVKRQAERDRAEAEQRRERLEKTVTDLWDRYGKEAMAVENKPRTIVEKTRLWRRRIKPALGHLKVKDVTEEDAGAVVRAALRVDGEGRVVGGRAEGGNTYRLLHHMFRKALAWGLRPKELGNPLENVAEPKTRRRERLLAPGEIGALLKALDRAEAEQREYLQVVAAIRATILTGARISELTQLRWQDIRRDEMELHLPDTKTGFSRRPVSAETLAIFDRVERTVGSPFVFRAVKSATRPLPYNTVEKAFRRIVEAAGVPNCTLHTVRHWFSTATANSVNNPRVGMALTGHKSHQAYLTYVHGDKQQAQALAEQLAALAKQLGQAEPNMTGDAESSILNRHRRG
jgi:integrase